MGVGGCSSDRFNSAGHYLIFADIGEEHILVAPTVARYGDRWYMADLFSTTRKLMNLHYLGYYLYGFAYGPDITLPGQP